jgi:hypothetical protein
VLTVAPTQTFPSATVRFVAPVSGPNHILIRSNLADFMYEGGLVTQEEQSRPDIICRIQQTATIGQVLFFRDADFLSRYELPRVVDKLGQLRLRVTLPGDRLALGFNGFEWSVRLRLYIDEQGRDGSAGSFKP